jgi:hypothetical protein
MQQLLDRSASTLASGGHPRELPDRAAPVLLDHLEDETDGFPVPTGDSPATSSGTFSPLISQVAREAEHSRARSAAPPGTPPRPGALQPGPRRHGRAGRPVVAGRPGRRANDRFAAHLVDPAYDGLAHLDPPPGLVDRS